MLSRSPYLRTTSDTTGVCAEGPRKTIRRTGFPTPGGCAWSRATRFAGRARSTRSRTNRRVTSAVGAVKTSNTGPISTISPCSRTATRSQISLMTGISCVMSTIVSPSFRLMSRSSVRMDCVVSGSSAEVASSQSSTAGSEASARAMPTRCFSPPESSAG